MSAPSPVVRFGVCLPQFGATWAEAREVAEAADEAGFDAVWAVDHFVGIPDETTPVLEAWTEIAAVAAVTRRVRLGHQVLCVAYRSPALLAKMAATLDVISGGRLVVGLGAGWHEPEYVQYGYEFPPIAARLAQLDEAAHVLRRLWTEERTTFEGRHFTVRDAVSYPKPVQPRLPIMIGGGGERVLLRHVARHADIWNNLGVNHGEVARKRDVLARHCRAIGRDPAAITISQQTLAAIATDRAEAARRTARVFEELGFLEGSPELALTGTPEEIRARVERNRALGITAYTMSFGRRTDPEDVRRFGRDVVAAYA
jgi:F420-dependent oxidoreductase-like protein